MIGVRWALIAAAILAIVVDTDVNLGAIVNLIVVVISTPPPMPCFPPLLSTAG